MSEEVWYVAYGSNVSTGRFLAYLRGGSVGSTGIQERGSTDPSPPLDIRPARIPHGLYFARSADKWGPGAVAFVETAPGERIALAVAYLITRDQFIDVFRQENALDAGAQVDLDELPGPENEPVLAADRGWYRAVIGLEPLDGRAALTFTHPAQDPGGPLPATRSYLATIAGGLREHHGLSLDAIVTYLASTPGCGWGERELRAALSDQLA